MNEKYETKPGVRLPRPEDVRPKRFYKTVTVERAETGWAVLLDGRAVRTPAKNTLAVPAEGLAQLIAGEWAEQGERIDAPAMPVARLCFVALDRMAGAREETVAEVTKYASTDLLCFRAPEPADLVAAQAAAWDPMLAWAERALDAHFVAATGVLPVNQDPVALQRVMAKAAGQDIWRLTALAHAAAICGSAILGLALLDGEIDGGEAFALSSVDEAYQASQWGEDAEAAERMALLKRELVSVERMLRALDAVQAA
jgi:chaperone required for assembly of F1-ATPase